jgi:two-component system chemotaxis sensor kinase CheA
VDIRKMDDLMNLLGELVINRTRSEDLVQELESLANDQKMVENLRESLNEESQIIDDIQAEVMSSRLVAVKSIFQEVSFVVRDMANRLGKEVDCRISGESTELDKRLVDSIRNPIMHVVKNAVDHGLEDPDEREEKGKDRQGVITVEAHREHNQILITISDDGRGIDLEKIREVAAKRGIMDPGHADSLSEEEIVGLLCLPGFSSREKVTGDSGRGVGMDVVKSILEEFNGKMEIHTEKDRGTCVLLRLPITLAIIRGLMIEEDGSRYILPISAISEVIRIKYRDMDIRANGEKMLKHRDSIMRIHGFSELLSGRELARSGEENCFVIIIRVRGEWRGLIVERLIGEREVVIKEVRKTFLNTRGISGVSIMGDGSVVLVIDIAELIRSEGISYMRTMSGID